MPNLSLPEGLSLLRLHGRTGLSRHIDAQRRSLEAVAEAERFDRHREAAISLLADPKVRSAFDVTNAAGRIQDRYGRNSFGWSLLMAFRLVQAGVNLVQVNLGNNETWDTHGDAFPRLKDKLLPPTDKALSALLDDLLATGLLDSTLIVMAGEFGARRSSPRCPSRTRLPVATTGAGSRPSSSRAAGPRAERSSVPRTAAAPSRPRRPSARKTWWRRSTTRSASPRQPSGTTRSTGRTRFIMVNRSAG